MDSYLNGILDNIKTVKNEALYSSGISNYVREKLVSQLELAETSIEDAISTVQGDI